MSGWTFGARSERCLSTVELDLEHLVRHALSRSPIDFAVICGHRSAEEQEEAYHRGASKLRWPQSLHNSTPSRAVDLAPWVNGGVPWDSHAHFYVLAGVVLASARALGVPLRWGGDWDGDWDLRDSRFIDLPHFELAWEQAPVTSTQRV